MARMVSCERVDQVERAAGRRVRIVHLDAAVFRSLAEGDLEAANQASPVALSPYFAGPD